MDVCRGSDGWVSDVFGVCAGWYDGFVKGCMKGCRTCDRCVTSGKVVCVTGMCRVGVKVCV